MNEQEEKSGVRVDKWLFSVRIFKTRSLAAQAVSSGKVKVNGETVKAHRLVHVGDEIQLKRDRRTLQYEVVGLVEKRVGAKDAAKLFNLTEDPDLSEEMREKVKLYRMIDSQSRPEKGRPSKRDRRMIDKLKQGDVF